MIIEGDINSIITQYKMTLLLAIHLESIII